MAGRPALRVHQISVIRENHGQAATDVSGPWGACPRALPGLPVAPGDMDKPLPSPSLSIHQSYTSWEPAGCRTATASCLAKEAGRRWAHPYQARGEYHEPTA